MPATLSVTVSQKSEAGVKGANEDACGIYIPEGPLLNTKGMAAIIADGMSGSEGGREAAEACVLGFLSDYFSTPESWSVKKSAGKVLAALNRWLHGQGQKRYGSHRGMVTTLSVLIIKSSVAYLFHIGDTRIYRLRGKTLECLTRDHHSFISGDRHCLSRAMGIDLALMIDCNSVPVEPGDHFILTTDGVHENLSPPEMREVLLESSNPEQAVKELIGYAQSRGSRDNLTCQMVRVDHLPLQDKEGLYEQLKERPFPPALEPGMVLDGYKILRDLHASNRIQIYLALDMDSGEEVVLKTPSVNFEDDPEYIERFLHEEWVGKRIASPHVLKILSHGRRRSFLYYVTEYLQGQTLRQWMQDHPVPTLSQVRSIIEQIARGLYAFHRLEMFHQDLKPENIIIDPHGTVKIIDFGSTKIAGIEEIAVPWKRNPVLGTLNYTAPESWKGEICSERSDLYSLGVIAYEMLTGKLPYGEALYPSPPKPLSYSSAVCYRPEIPAWVDGALRKAVQDNPKVRYEAISEFVHDLSHPNPIYLRSTPLPLLEKNPAGFWRTVALVLFVLNLVCLYFLYL